MMNRRDWLRRMSAVAAVPLMGGDLPVELAAWGREVHAALGAQQDATGLDDGAMRLLSAICDRIIPADDTPGAVAAGVPPFIAHMLTNWYDQTERDRVLAGLRDLEARQLQRFGRSFVDATGAQQDTWLLELDAQGAKSWFATVKYLTIWGYYTSEIGVKQELQQWPLPGRYDGCAPYAPRARSTSQPAQAVAGPEVPHVAD